MFYSCSIYTILFPVVKFKHPPFRRPLSFRWQGNPCAWANKFMPLVLQKISTRQLAGSISCKKLARPRTLTFLRHQNNNDRHDGKTHNFK